MLPTIAALIELMNNGRIAYCHWKSNWVLAATLDGETDLDLLIRRSDAASFRSMLRDLGFRPAIEAGFRPLPSVEHYHALDESTTGIAHVHAYYQVITGESLTKNFHLPIEGMLLENRKLDGPIPIPTAGAELIVFVLRMLLKYTSPVEFALVLRDTDAVKHEAEWLVSDAAIGEALQLLPEWLPQIDSRLFVACVDALRTPGHSMLRIRLGLRVRRRLRGFARRGMLQVWLTEAGMLTTKALHRITGSKKKLTPGAGGAVIAFVGSEATGKSTLISEVQAWLAEHFTVKRVHAGKPPSTWATLIPHILLPLLRRLLPRQRTTRVEAGQAHREQRSDTYPLMFGIRAVMLAYERKALLTRAFARSANGTVVLCDRYPSARIGAADSPQLRPAGASSIRRVLGNLENRLYRDTPTPDLVIHLFAPLDVTLARNMARDKTEPEDYVRLRHSKTLDVEFPGVAVHRIDTARSLASVVEDVKRLIWEAL